MNTSELAEPRGASHLAYPRRLIQTRYLLSSGRQRLRLVALHRRLPRGRRVASELLPELYGARRKEWRGAAGSGAGSSSGGLGRVPRHLHALGKAES